MSQPIQAIRIGMLVITLGIFFSEVFQESVSCFFQTQAGLYVFSSILILWSLFAVDIIGNILTNNKHLTTAVISCQCYTSLGMAAWGVIESMYAFDKKEPCRLASILSICFLGLHVVIVTAGIFWSLLRKNHEFNREEAVLLLEEP